MSTEEPPQDYVSPDDAAVPPDLEKNVKSRSTWIRLIFMIAFFILYAISRFVVFATITLQFLWVLFTAETNAKLKSFGQALATYTYEIVLYLTFNSDEKPFPFDRDWPDSKPS